MTTQAKLNPVEGISAVQVELAIPAPARSSHIASIVCEQMVRSIT